MVKNGVLWRNDYFIFCEEEREAERENEGLNCGFGENVPLIFYFGDIGKGYRCVTSPSPC